MFLRHSISIRNILVSFEGESTWQAISNPVRMWLEFSKFFIPADSVSFRHRVTGA